MFDHVGFHVSDFARSFDFYRRALEPLGLTVISQGDNWGMIGSPDGRLWIDSMKAASTPVHIAFRAKDRAQVQAFHAAALAAGGEDHGGPGLRPEYAPDYYAAFVLDPDGHNVEAKTTAGE